MFYDWLAMTTTPRSTLFPDDFFGLIGLTSDPWQLRGDDGLSLNVEVPGVRAEDIEVRYRQTGVGADLTLTWPDRLGTIQNRSWKLVRPISEITARVCDGVLSLFVGLVPAPSFDGWNTVPVERDEPKRSSSKGR